MKSQRTERTVHPSYYTSVWFLPLTGKYSVAAAMGGFCASYTKQGIFSPDSPEFRYFHFSIPLVNRVE
jgi:hypothetical protein